MFTFVARYALRTGTVLALACILALPVSRAAAGGPAPSSGSNAFSPPTMAQIRAVMARTVEVQNPSESFVPEGKPVTISDGRGTGTITAVVGRRNPTADGLGQLVFFFHNATFVSWDTNVESEQIQGIQARAPGMFAVTYTHYGPKDPTCCPTLKPVTITYSWSSSDIFISPAIPPKFKGALKVRLKG